MGDGTATLRQCPTCGPLPEAAFYPNGRSACRKCHAKQVWAAERRRVASDSTQRQGQRSVARYLHKLGENRPVCEMCGGSTAGAQPIPADWRRPLDKLSWRCRGCR